MSRTHIPTSALPTRTAWLCGGTARFAVAAATVLLAAATTAAQTTEGIDLTRQITSQWVKPNIMLVVDESGSMGWPLIRSNSDTTGTVAGSSYSY